MAALTDARILELLEPFAPSASQIAGRLAELAPKFSVYLELLLRWNARTNLTSVREPDEIVQRHFGESVFAAAMLDEHVGPVTTLLDFGSGAGFPGLPMQLCLPQLRVCLAESQGKKASFLREAVRTLGLTAEVWAARVESMPAERRFDFVALRAVDRMDVAVETAQERVAPGGKLLFLAADLGSEEARGTVTKHLVPLSRQRFLTLVHGR